MTTFAIAIPCHNEAQNIGVLLECLDTGWEGRWRPERIAVFSSACRDGTEAIVRRFAAVSRIPVELETESGRSGKSHAINRLMQMAGDVDVIVLVSGDVIIAGEDVKTLLRQFDDPRVGAAGGRPVPTSRRRHMTYRVSRVMWDIHHIMATLAPKTTEVTAFRRLGFRIDESAQADEAEIESRLTERGFAVSYCPEVTIRNATPTTLKAHMHQRIRVTRGHLTLWRGRRYCVGSLRPATRWRALRRYVTGHRKDRAAFCLMLVLEACVLATAGVQGLTCGRRTGVWSTISSAKQRVV